MNREVAKRWAAALESGEYEQGHGELRDVRGRYCCLGVLCELSGLGTWDGPRYLGERFVVPPQVAAWAELTTRPVEGIEHDDGCANPELRIPAYPDREYVYLTDLNDGVYDFASSDDDDDNDDDNDDADDDDQVTVISPWDFGKIAALIRERWADL